MPPPLKDRLPRRLRRDKRKEAKVHTSWLTGAMYVDAGELIRSPSFQEQLEGMSKVQKALEDEKEGGPTSG